MASRKKHSIEERVEDWCKQQFKGQKYYTKTESINPEIEDALRKAPSKKGGSGSNFPDIKCFIQTSSMRRIPVMIEVKGTKGDFIKLDTNNNIENKKKDNEPNYTNIAKYAVNGAIQSLGGRLHQRTHLVSVKQVHAGKVARTCAHSLLYIRWPAAEVGGEFLSKIFREPRH